MLNVLSIATIKKTAIEYTQKKMIKRVNISLSKIKSAKTKRKQKYKKQGTKEIIGHIEEKLENKSLRSS